MASGAGGRIRGLGYALSARRLRQLSVARGAAFAAPVCVGCAPQPAEAGGGLRPRVAEADALAMNGMHA